MSASSISLKNMGIHISTFRYGCFPKWNNVWGTPPKLPPWHSQRGWYARYSLEKRQWILPQNNKSIQPSFAQDRTAMLLFICRYLLKKKSFLVQNGPKEWKICFPIFQIKELISQIWDSQILNGKNTRYGKIPLLLYNVSYPIFKRALHKASMTSRRALFGNVGEAGDCRRSPSGASGGMAAHSSASAAILAARPLRA